MIREGNIKDIKIINKLAKNLISNFDKTYDVEKYLKNDNYIILVNSEEEINAFLIFFKNIDFYELEVIFVSQEKRKQNIATKLLDYFFKEYYSKDKKDIILEVAVNNISAINLYKKFDFEIINIRKKYYNGIDAYIMKKVSK